MPAIAPLTPSRAGLVAALTMVAACTPRRGTVNHDARSPLVIHAPETSRDASMLDVSADAELMRDASPDGARDANRCPVRGSPPQTISLNEPTGDPVAVGWNGREWGLAWTEGPESEPVTFFARIGSDGVRRGAPVRLSEPGYRGGAPSLAWTGENWVVAYAGGAGRLDELWVARIDARGLELGRPERLTARDRDDGAPALAFNGRDLLVAWSARLGEHRHAVYALRLSRYGAQIDAPVLLGLREIERISNASVVWTGTNWGVAWLVSRLEPVAVDMRRLEPDASRPYHEPVRVTFGALGGTGSGGTARYALAWDGQTYGLVWDEVQNGAPRVFFSTVSLRLNVLVPRVMLSGPSDRSGAPTLASLGPGAFAAAWETERGGGTRHVVVSTIDGSGRVLGETVGIQGPDGRASRPAIAVGDDAIGVAVIGRRGLIFNVVSLGPCPPDQMPSGENTAAPDRSASPPR